MVNPAQINKIKEVLNTLASDTRYQAIVEFRQNMRHAENIEQLIAQHAKMLQRLEAEMAAQENNNDFPPEYQQSEQPEQPMRKRAPGQLERGHVSGMQQPAHLHPATRDQYKAQNMADMKQNRVPQQQQTVNAPTQEELAAELDDASEDDINIDMSELDTVDEEK